MSELNVEKGRGGAAVSLNRDAYPEDRMDALTLAHPPVTLTENAAGIITRGPFRGLAASITQAIITGHLHRGRDVQVTILTRPAWKFWQRHLHEVRYRSHWRAGMTNITEVRRQEIAELVHALQPEAVVEFLKTHGVHHQELADKCHLRRATFYTWQRGVSPNLKNWQVFQAALIEVMLSGSPRRLARRRFFMDTDPELAQTVRQLALTALSRNEIDEVAAANLLGITHEEWKAHMGEQA